MTWPLSQDYNESIQDPPNSFSDAELKTGEAVANALGIPMPRSGNFADVYEVRCPSGSRWAVKCFTREVHGLRERYSEISKYLRLANLPFMVDFKYLEQGIRVRGQWYPILKMQWVEGFVLNEFVRDNLDKKPILQALGQIWLRMARRLRESYIAHCDLQHGNVMFVPGSTANSLAVKLIDYDGMCVPSLAGTKSGEVGHPAYQHPERLRTGAYDQEVDRFSLLSIATALRCLTIGGRSLWERYDNGDNLLFRQADLQAPTESPLFQELMAIGDPQTRTLVTELFRACQGSLTAVPLLTDLAPEEKPASKVTKTVSTSASGARPVAGAPGPDWDFGAEEPAASVVKKPTKKSGTPMWVWGAVGGAAALLMLIAGLSLFFFKGSADKKAAAVAQIKAETKKSKPSAKDKPPPNDAPANPITQENKPPQAQAPALDFLHDAVLLMNFDKNTFYQNDGKTYVRDLSKYHNDGLCAKVAYTAEGKAGGGLACDGGYLRLKHSLINRLPNYTLMVWVRVADAQGDSRWIYARATEQLKDSNYSLWTNGGGGLGIAAWNEDHGPDLWVNSSPNQPVIAKDQWVFLAVRLREGGSGRGDLRLFVEDHPYQLRSQMVKGSVEDTFDFLGVNLKAVLDEVVLCPRALSDSEIQAVRQQGIEGRPLRASPKPILVQPPTEDINSPKRIFQLAPGGDKLAISEEGDKTWKLLDPRTNQVIRTFAGHQGAVNAVAFSADGRRALTGSEDRSARLWDVQSGELIRTIPWNSPIRAVALSGDGRRAGIISARDVRSCQLLDLETGRPHGYGFSRRPTCLTFSPDNQTFLAGLDRGDKDRESVMMLWTPGPGGRIRAFFGHPECVACVALSADGRYAASGYLGGSRAVTLWEVATGKLVWQRSLPLGSINQVVFSPDSRILLAAAGTTIRLFQVPSGQLAGQLEVAREDLTSAGFSSDSKLAFAASFEEGKVRLLSLIPTANAVASAASTGPQSTGGWDRPVDPTGDCQFRDDKGKLTITVPAKPHVLDLSRDGMNSPRLLSDIEGDFTVQVRVGGDFTPAATSSTGRKTSWIGAGLLLWVNDNTFLRLERAGWYGRQPSTLYANWEVREDGKYKDTQHNFPSLSAAETYLRLERRGKQILASYSEDGQNWRNVNPLDIELPAKVKIGILAGSTSARPFTPIFEQFQIIKGQGELVRVDWPPLGAEAAVVVKPSRRPRSRRFSNKVAVPGEATLTDKRKLLEVLYKDDYKGKSKRALAAQMLEDSKKQGDLAMCYVMLKESCDLAARDGDADTGLRAASELGKRYAVDPLEVKCRVLEETLPVLSAKAKDKYRLLTQKALLLLDRAVIDDNFDLGERLLEVAKAAAAKADMKILLGKLVTREADQFKAIRQAYAAVKDAVDKLESDADDADANLALGRFRCFVRDDWETGLPLLVKGRDKALSELAQKDVADPADADARAALGDAWRERADKMLGKEQSACRRRAVFWYQDCVDDLDKKDQARVSARLKRLASQLTDPNTPFPDLDVGIATFSRKTGFLRLPPHQRLTTRQVYRGPIDIRVTAVLPQNHIRITFLNGGEMSLNAKNNRTVEVKYYGHYAVDPDGEGSWGPNGRFTQLQPNSPVQIRLVATRDNCTIWINGKQVLAQGSGPPFTSFAPSPVRVWSDDGEIDVKALVVKRIH